MPAQPLHVAGTLQFPEPVETHEFEDAGIELGDAWAGPPDGRLDAREFEGAADDGLTCACAGKASVVLETSARKQRINPTNTGRRERAIIARLPTRRDRLRDHELMQNEMTKCSDQQDR